MVSDKIENPLIILEDKTDVNAERDAINDAQREHAHMSTRISENKSFSLALVHLCPKVSYFRVKFRILQSSLFDCTLSGPA